MPTPLSKIVPGTIGNKPCEISLNKILIDHDDAILTQRVMRIHQEFVLGAREIVKSGMAKKYKETILIMWRDRQVSKTITAYETGKLPEVVYTHLRCCLVASYRDELKKAKEALCDAN